ncbi:MAG: class I SAM-dependent methyltransferase [Bacteroidetes bacterium]|nr:class I SAM-dependent methyltransferase [Bacteroidota bacterium]
MRSLKALYKFLSPKFQKIFLDYTYYFQPRYGHGRPPHPGLSEIVNRNRAEYAALLNEFLSYREIFFNIPVKTGRKANTEPCWDNHFFPGLDIIGLYGLLNHYKPRKYVEIGSGNSTMVARKAIKEGKLETRITSIDPMPRAIIDDISDVIVRKPLEEMEDLGFIEELEENDILFIDNSHRCLPNSDVTVCFLELIPRLKKGVIIHIHDVYLPYDYPQFMCDRAYSEQYLLAAMLLAAPGNFRVLLPNFFISEDPELKKILDPVWNDPRLKGVEKHGGSFWFTKC